LDRPEQIVRTNEVIDVLGKNCMIA